jgi:phosphoribosylformimino-5-aminoimidazole carboxamide ribotide isomerase
MDLYARINILGGLSVRLPRGRLEDAIALDNDPIGRAKSWVEQGAEILHIVDLDAAAYGDYRNRDLVDRLIREVSVPVQVAGGIRSENEAIRLIENGAWRIVMGTAAIENQNMVWDLCRDNPDRIAVSIDVHKDEEVVTKGWTQNSGRYLEEVLIEMSSAGVVSFLVSEAGRDALEDPPNYQIMAESLATVEQPVIAAGGVRDLEDLRKLVRLEAAGRYLDGVVVGREVTVGRFTIEEAKSVIAGVGPLRAPGGVAATRIRVGVSSLADALAFYEDRLGFAHMRTPVGGVAGAILEPSKGQLLELVEGDHGEPRLLTFVVEDLARWADHLESVGLELRANDNAVEFEDPDGRTIRFEAAL